MVNAVTPFNEPIILHGNSWKHYISNLPAASVGQQSFLVPARFASLKQLVLLPRTQFTNPSLGYTLSSRASPNIGTINWRVGGANVPQRAVRLYDNVTTFGYAESYIELVKAWHGLGRANLGSMLGSDLYNVADTGDGTVGGGVVGGTIGVRGVFAVGTGAALVATDLTSTSYKNGFAFATNMDLWPNRNDIIISGCNTLSTQIFLDFTIWSAITGNYVLDTYANYDAIFILENGLLSARF